MSEGFTHKSGYIGIVGKPNAGKSTLLNYLVGQKLAITSPKPQTTRHRTLGILTTDDYQMVFIDTPGIHTPKDQLHQFMKQEVDTTLDDVDVVLFLADPTSPPDDDDLLALEYLKKQRKPAVFAFNKSDMKSTPNTELYGDILDRFPVIHISALKGTGCDELLAKILNLLPAGPKYFDEETVTDRSERFIVSELIREQIYNLFEKEIPYSVAVITEEVKDRGDGMTYIQATIHVEKDSQKGIIIGSGGRMLKKIGQQARADIEEMLGTKVYLELWVKVKKNWRRDNSLLHQLGMDIIKKK